MAIARSCESIPVDWDPFTPGSPLAVLSATLAGFVVVCLVAVAADRGRPRRGEIVVLLGCALACLLVAGFVGSAISREPSCLLGWAQNLFATALMSVAAVAVCCGLAWLLWSYLGADPLLLAAGRWSAYGMIALVTLFQALNAQRFLLDTTGGSASPGWPGWLVVGYPPLMLGALVLVRACWLARPTRLAGCAQRRVHRPARIAAIVTLTFVLISLILSNALAGRRGSGGVVVPTWAVHVAVVVPMLLAAAPVLTLAYALPHQAGSGRGTPTAQPSAHRTPAPGDRPPGRRGQAALS